MDGTPVSEGLMLRRRRAWEREVGVVSWEPVGFRRWFGAVGTDEAGVGRCSMLGSVVVVVSRARISRSAFM